MDSLACRLDGWAGESEELASITHFEFLLALAVETFRERRVDLALLEVGMGGRLDATPTQIGTARNHMFVIVAVRKRFKCSK